MWTAIECGSALISCHLYSSQWGYVKMEPIAIPIYTVTPYCVLQYTVLLTQCGWVNTGTFYVSWHVQINFKAQLVCRVGETVVTHRANSYELLTVFTHIHITQYGSTVCIGIGMGGPALLPYIRKFWFLLSVSISIWISRWRTCKKVTACKNWMKMSHEV